MLIIVISGLVAASRRRRRVSRNNSNNYNITTAYDLVHKRYLVPFELAPQKPDDADKLAVDYLIGVYGDGFWVDAHSSSGVTNVVSRPAWPPQYQTTK